MIKESIIRHIVEEKIKGSGLFIVDISVKPDNKINVYLDSKEGLTISDCVEISRYIENKLDREQEDFALEISSAGLNMPFRVAEQYIKNIGKPVKVKTNDGNVFKGVLISSDKDFLVIETEVKNKKESLKTQEKLALTDIKETRLDLMYFK